MAASSAVRLVVGLGNPGSQYQRTRHNAGFWFLDELASRWTARFRSDPRCQAESATAELSGHSVHLLKPMGFMNRSGQSVAVFARYHKVPAEQILVVHDELDFEAGVVRLKLSGGHGGHNGLRDIIAALGTAGFIRMRVGIGRPPAVWPVTNYVLSRPTDEEERAIHAAIQRGLQQLPLLCDGNLSLAMNELNAG